MEGAKEVVAAGPAVGLGGGEVGGVAVDVEDHVTRVIANDRVWMGRHVVEELVDSLSCFFCWFSLLPRDLTQTA